MSRTDFSCESFFHQLDLTRLSRLVEPGLQRGPQQNLQSVRLQFDAVTQVMLLLPWSGKSYLRLNNNPVDRSQLSGLAASSRRGMASN